MSGGRELNHGGRELVIGALGVVFGDIGTSPLYTIRVCLHGLGDAAGRASVLGVLSLIFWSLTIVVTVKYIGLVMRADNRGEGGIFALLSFLPQRSKRNKLRIAWVASLILIGAALLYGDGVITPAISVLSAAEGLKNISTDLQPFVVAISCVILLGLFWAQRKGTRKIGFIFGPVMLVWFVTLGVTGLISIVRNPSVLMALNPMYAFEMLKRSHAEVVALLGGVVLAVTGAEALYADMGHFGTKAIRTAWFGLVLPGLLLNYFGQGALVLAHPAAASDSFLSLVPAGPLQAGLIGLSVVATIIASQALISGTFSLTQQAVQLGYFPRVRIRFTNPDQKGQIYIPVVNGLLAFACILTVIGFGSSDRLAAAYGIAVTGTMGVTTFAFFLFIRSRWKWPLWKAAPMCLFFLVVDLTFLGANLHKVVEGGWLPLLLGGLLFLVMHSWRTGRDHVAAQIYTPIKTFDVNDLLTQLKSGDIVRVPGCAVFMVSNPTGVPVALLHHIKVNRCLQKNIVFLSVLTEGVPYVGDEGRLEAEQYGEGVWRIIGRYGYMESPDVERLLQEVPPGISCINDITTTFIFNREMIIAGGESEMPEWEKKLYGLISRNALTAKDYFNLPPKQIVEMGLPVHL